MKNSRKPDPAKIDELGRVRAEMKVLKKQDADLSKEIKPLMGDGEIISTGAYRAELIVRNNKVIDWEAVRKILGQKKFNELASISIEDLKKVMGDDQIDSVTVDFKQVRTLNIDPL